MFQGFWACVLYFSHDYNYFIIAFLLDCAHAMVPAVSNGKTSNYDDGKRLQCPFCERIYGYETNLRAHIRQRHQGIRVPCPFCSRTFTRNNTVRRHIAHEHKTEQIPFQQMALSPFQHATELSLFQQKELSRFQQARELSPFQQTNLSSVQQATQVILPDMCVVCLVEKADHTVVPCGHICLCGRCAVTLPKKNCVFNCPACKEQCNGIIRIHIS